MGFERNYQIKIPSKQFNTKSFYTLKNVEEIDLNPWFITGFTDAEGCFSIKIQPNAKLSTTWRVRPVFSITLHIKDLIILEKLKKSLGVGNIIKSKKSSVIFAVDSIKDIPVILDHFDKYPLITQKLSDYLLFKQCFEIIKKKEHLTDKGLLEILSLKSSLNLGLPDKLKKVFPKLVLKFRPEYVFKGIPHPFWVSGFSSGDASFHIVLRDNNSESSVFARFSIHLHIRELKVLKGILSYLFSNNNSDCERKFYIEKKIYLNAKSANLQITKFEDIVNTLIPFFDKYPIIGMKRLDYLDFKEVCKIIEKKEHLTSTSISKILNLRSGMN